ncbi:MAG: sterol desaturase family protein [Gemmataceae bacterium]
MDTSLPSERPRHFGSGWISGTLSVSLGLVGLLGVLCFHFPSLLTMTDARAHYPLPLIRGLLHVILVAGFLAGFASVMLRQNKTLGLVGMGLVLVAALLGGSRVEIEGSVHGDYYLGLDYFLLSLIFWSIVFIPLEKLFGRLDQGVFRKGWRVDLTYYFVSSLMVQLTSWLTLKPAMVFFNWAVSPGLQERVRLQPTWLQIVEIMFLADLVQYWVHRLFHVVPCLWRFHAVHHSTEVLDWMSGSRLHLVDLVVSRSAMYVPAYVLGFSDLAMYSYIVFVSVDATFIHANLRFGFGPLRWLFATPQFHHWHHGSEREAIDKNFAVHFPFLDMLFGTFYLPGDRWPSAYGVHSNDVPAGYLAQWLYPFRRPKPSALASAEKP